MGELLLWDGAPPMFVFCDIDGNRLTDPDLTWKPLGAPGELHGTLVGEDAAALRSPAQASPWTGFAAVLLGLTVWGHRRDEGRRFH